jgi:hypothetical protein
MARKPLPKIPLVVRRNIMKAIHGLEVAAFAYECGKDPFTLLSEYRANRPHGITNPTYVMATPPFLLAAIEKLDDAFNAAHNLNPADYLCKGVAKEFGRQGGSPAIHNDDEIKDAIRMIVDKHQGDKKLKGTEIIELVQRRLTCDKRPVPGKTKIHNLLQVVRQEEPKKIR